MLELEKLTINTGTFSVKDISLQIKSGSCHVLVGPTGCGKTTLLEAIIGIRKPDSGIIRLEGRQINDLPIEKRGIAYLPQDLALFPHLTVEGNIFYGLKQQKRLKEGQRDFVLELTKNLGITHLLKRSMDHLSGGERQRVALVRALATGSRYLLLDEPLSALHEAIKRDIWQLILRLKLQLGLTIVMISHDLEEAFFLGNEISVMINGKILQSGEKEDVYERPSHLVVANFLGIKNLFHATVKQIQDNQLIVKLQEIEGEFLLSKECQQDLSALPPDSTFVIGIRPENVMLLRPEISKRQPHNQQHNLITGRIEEIFFQGTNYVVIFRPEHSSMTIHIDVPSYAAEKMGLKQADRITACLRSEKLFQICAISDSGF